MPIIKCNRCFIIRNNDKSKSAKNLISSHKTNNSNIIDEHSYSQFNMIDSHKLILFNSYESN